MNKKKERIGIIGGGASGLMTAVLLARQGFSVTIVEQKDKIGKKLITTGNGRCNISNRYVCEKHYFSRSQNLMKQLLNRDTLERTLNFFESVGITTKELEKGKLYPYSLEAKSVVKAFLYELEYQGVQVIYNTKAVKLDKEEKWRVEVEQKREEDVTKNQNTKMNKDLKNSKKSTIKTKRQTLSFDKIVLCAGGMSYPVSGSDGSGFALAKRLGHTVIKPIPAIVQLIMNEKQFPYYKHLSGTKTKAKVSLMDKNSQEVLRTEEEEFLFTAYGVSGPAVLLLSSTVAYALAESRELELNVNFFPEKSYAEVVAFLEGKVLEVSHFTILQVMEMVMPNRLINVLLKETGINGETRAGDLSKSDLKKMIDFLTNLCLEVVAPYQWEQAQVTAGGISCLEVNPTTLESQKRSGLYFAGEVLDMDGDCGGFNLQWAWTSAMVVADAIGK